MENVARVGVALRKTLHVPDWMKPKYAAWVPWLKMTSPSATLIHRVYDARLAWNQLGVGRIGHKGTCVPA